MNVLSRIDDWLLDRVFNPTTWGFEHRYGFHKSQVALGATALVFICLLKAWWSMGLAPFFLGGFMTAAMMVVVVREEAEVRTKIDHWTRGGVSHLRDDWRPIRAIISFTMLFKSFMLIGLLSSVVNESLENFLRWVLMSYLPLWSILYIISTDKLPPAENTVPQA